MSSLTTTMNSSGSSIVSENNELTLEIPVWVHGKRKWVTGITKKTTFDDLIYALLAQADLLKTTGIQNSSSSNGITGYAIAECIQLTSSTSNTNNNTNEPETSLITQRIIKGRAKVVKAHKNWQFDKLPLTILHLISTPSLLDNSMSTTKFRSKIFRRFLSGKPGSTTSTLFPTSPPPPLPPLPPPSILSSSQSDSSLSSTVTPTIIGGSNSIHNRQKTLNDFHESTNILERQKRLLDYLDEKIHQTESNIPSKSRTTDPSSSSTILTNEHSFPSASIVTFHDILRLFAHHSPINHQSEQQLVFATQLCNSILNMQEQIEEKTSVLYAVEQAISNELNSVLHQQHYDTLPGSMYGTSLISNNNNDNSSLSSADLMTLKNSIYRSRELSRLQSKEMHDLDLSLREVDILLGSKYDELKHLEYETSSNSMGLQRPITPSYHHVTLQQQQQQPHYRSHIDEQHHQQTPYDTLELATTTVAFTSIKEADEDSGINSLTSDDSNHHSMPVAHHKMNTPSSQLETLV